MWLLDSLLTTTSYHMVGCFTIGKLGSLQLAWSPWHPLNLYIFHPTCLSHKHKLVLVTPTRKTWISSTLASKEAEIYIPSIRALNINHVFFLSHMSRLSCHFRSTPRYPGVVLNVCPVLTHWWHSRPPEPALINIHRKNSGRRRPPEPAFINIHHFGNHIIRYGCLFHICNHISRCGCLP